MSDGFGYVTGRYYSSEYDTLADVALAADVQYMSMFNVSEQCVFTEIGINVSTAAGTLARLGIYKAAGGTGTLLLDAGTVSIASTGNRTAAISQILYPGPHFLAVLANGAPTIKWHTTSAKNRTSIYGSSTSTLDGASLENLVYILQAFGALPSGLGTLTFSAIQLEPHIWLRK